jgi:hypothetical protein
MSASTITIPYPGGQRAGPIAVEEAQPFLRAPMALENEHGDNLQLHQLLQAAASQLRDQCP